MKYRIGLDIGVTSVGWAAYECNKTGEPQKLLGLGSRIFEAAENPKDGTTGAAKRREARGLRRRLRRRAHRAERVRALFLNSFKDTDIENVNIPDIYKLRAEGLDRKLTQEELYALLRYFVKHRGFESTRKSELKSKDTGKLLAAVQENEKLFNEKGYRTVGEMLYKDTKYFDIKDGKRIYHTRNKGKNYSNTFARKELLKEIELILEKQVQQGLISKEFKDKYVEIFKSRRSYDEGPAYPSKYRIENYPVGKCPFYKDEYRASKASYTFGYFTALQKINNLKIKKINGEERTLTDEEKRYLFEKIKTAKSLTYEQVKKQLNIDTDARFNLLSYKGAKKEMSENEYEKAVFVTMAQSYEIRSKLNEENKGNIPLIDKIAEIISQCKSDEKRLKRFSETEETKLLTDSEKEGLLELDYSKFGSLSVKAMNKIIPYLEKGQKYDTACASAGFDFRMHSGMQKAKKLSDKYLKEVLSEEELAEHNIGNGKGILKSLLDEINSPVVRRSVSQTIKVLNSIIDKYGSPCAVNIELARELSKTHKERQDIKRENDDRERKYESIRQELASKFHKSSISPLEIMKVRLYDEQGGKCAYSLTPFDLDRIINEPDYAEVDHIIPYSRSFDDRYSNKVLVKTRENRDKGNKIPFEYFGSDAKRWNDFNDFIAAHYSLNKFIDKRNNLLRETFTEKDAMESKQRTLNDTKYITRFLFNLINDYLYLDTLENKKKQVTAVNGRITAYLRKVWGLKKVRTDGDKHHAMDAAVIACVTDGMVNKITRYNMKKELGKKFDNGKVYFTDADGVLLENDEYDKLYLDQKKPYEGFVEELDIKLSENPEKLAVKYLDKLNGIGYESKEINEFKPIFVSRMPERKATGSIHKETIRSARTIDKGYSSSKTELTKLKLTADKSAIAGYNEKAKKDDRLLYEALLERLRQFNGNAGEAFKEPFYKPTQSGLQGNPVKSVWIDEKITDYVLLNDGKALANNGPMLRTDIFYKDGKYYCVPVYVKDYYSKKLPNKAICAGKKYEDWDTIDDSYEFKFTLYKNDLVYIRAKKSFNLSPAIEGNKEKIQLSEGLFYYQGINISSGAASIINHDKSFKTEIGFKMLPEIKKYCVDILGNVSEVKSEKRDDKWDS